MQHTYSHVCSLWIGGNVISRCQHMDDETKALSTKSTVLQYPSYHTEEAHLPLPSRGCKIRYWERFRWPPNVVGVSLRALITGRPHFQNGQCWQSEQCFPTGEPEGSTYSSTTMAQREVRSRRLLTGRACLHRMLNTAPFAKSTDYCGCCSWIPVISM